jgi:hypothetical protein
METAAIFPTAQHGDAGTRMGPFLLRRALRGDNDFVERPAPAGGRKRVVSITPTIPYSAQYDVMNREGHECPPPTFGAPTLVWHLGISPHEDEAGVTPNSSLAEMHNLLVADYEKGRQKFFDAVNRLLRLLQESIPYSLTTLQLFNAACVPRPWKEDEWTQGEPFRVTQPENLRFTLWWPDDPGQRSAAPPVDALRIKVHATAYRDYVTLSFYLDAGKPWNRPAFVRGKRPEGQRRRRIFEHIESVCGICEGRLAGSPGTRPMVEAEILPERDLSEADAAALMRASRFLYSQLWDEFWETLRLPSLDQVLGDTGRVFANFRGAVLPTAGTDAMPLFPGSTGDNSFPRFVGNGGLNDRATGSSKEPNEANAVVKAFWPFVRRITPNADQREYIACGVMNWRALYISALSSARAFAWEEEADGSETDIPAGHLPESFIERTTAPDGAEVRLFDSQSGSSGEGPIRYLVLSKGEPHRRQIGRILDRINTMGTMRLIALRDWTIIRDASTQIQLRGLELDTMMRKWNEKRSELGSDFERRKRENPKDERAIQDEEEKAHQKLADDIERELIDLSAALDRVGARARSGLHFRINRSRFYATEFESLVASLKVGNIDTWVAYDQFVTRGLKPAFDFIDGVGHRLLGLRTRLQTVLSGIETSALVTQISATRQNTAELRIIASAVADANRWLNNAIFWLRIFSIVVSLLVAAATLIVGGGGPQGVWGFVKWAIERMAP